VSELMTDLDWVAAARYPAANEDWGPMEGRHAYHEDAGLTPIFHALSRSGWNGRQRAAAAPPRSGRPDPVDAFRRDPLTAPIPVQAPVPAPARRRPAVADVPSARDEMSDTGRHHVRRPRW
jgi:hypothetical protein